MKLQEYQAKALFRQAGIPIPASMLASDAEQVKRAASEIGFPVVLKAQTLESGRGKAGGVRIVNKDNDVENISNEVFKLEINEQPVHIILVEKAFTFLKEYYLGIYTDLDGGMPILRVSEGGGATYLEPDSFFNTKIVDQKIDINGGLHRFQIRQLLTQIDISPTLWKQFESIALKLYKIYRENDATLAEINSLVVTHQQQLYALDVKVSIDNQALYRQEGFVDAFDPSYFGWVERKARKFGVAYHQFPGELGCIVNGMGLVYLTLDLLISKNTVPAAVIDIHGGSSVSAVASSLELLYQDERVKAILINVFGGMTMCDEIADGILAASALSRHKKPVFLRLKGTNEVRALETLSGLNNLSIFENTPDLVEGALEYLKGNA